MHGGKYSHKRQPHMNKTELTTQIAEEAGVTKADAKKMIDAFITVTKNALRAGEDVTLIGFGSFKVAERKSRVGMNPRTHEKIQIPARRVLKFKPGAELESAVTGE